MTYIDAQLKMAAEAETAMVAEGKRLDAMEREYGRLHDSEHAEHHRLTRICMGHYRLALHAAGLLDARARFGRALALSSTARP